MRNLVSLSRYLAVPVLSLALVACGGGGGGSDDDDDCSVLIVDWGNDRLQVMSEQGEFTVLQLQPPVSRPRSAVLFKNNLIVASIDKFQIHKYSC